MSQALEFLESLGPEEALRYKCWSTARFHAQVVERVRACARGQVPPKCCTLPVLQRGSHIHAPHRASILELLHARGLQLREPGRLGPCVRPRRLLDPHLRVRC